MSFINLTTMVDEFEWVIRVLGSTNKGTQLNTALKCFLLWEKKYSEFCQNKHDKQLFNYAKKVFWKKYEKKINNLGTTNI